MEEIKDDARSTFSHSVTLNEDPGVEPGESADHDATEGTPAGRRSLSEAKDKSITSGKTDIGTVQVVFGPAKRCVFVSSLIGLRISYSGKCLFAEKYLDGPWAVTCYAISPHGDELGIHHGRDDKIPGWSWRAGGAANSPSYTSLKAWLNEMLTSNTQNFTKIRVVFGSGASYYATCGDKYTWHDLPSELLQAIQQYRKVFDKLQELKAVRDSSSEPVAIKDDDISAIPGPLPLKAENFNLDKLPSTWLPQCLALGMRNCFAATWGSAYLISLPSSNKLYERITTKPQDVKKAINISLSLFSPSHYALLLDDWSYRHVYDPDSLNLADCIKEHIQAYVKLKPGRYVTLETLPISTGIASTERFDENTNFKMKLTVGKEKNAETVEKTKLEKNKEEEKEKEKEKEREKQKKPRRLSRLFGRSQKETVKETE
ncbi:hypothetical protein H2198_005460 [Neophaeococcomyces mojaviensis]|uniref:Uncharacterized protein n=1 Tax=Neophaeococcomyces mojaviensis TaxID=3383035 RepID=A0ACC3A6F1_9EURO|nr:hypothetical protein H2198_005460 [Knufia sp. JES_112]